MKSERVLLAKSIIMKNTKILMTPFEAEKIAQIIINATNENKTKHLLKLFKEDSACTTKNHNALLNLMKEDDIYFFTAREWLKTSSYKADGFEYAINEDVYQSIQKLVSIINIGKSHLALH